MKKLRISLSIALIAALSLLMSCENSSTQPSQMENIFPADEITLILPLAPAMKGNVVDQDQTFTLTRRNHTNFESNGFRFHARPNSVDEDTEITADWMGDWDEPALGYEFGPEGLVFNKRVEIGYELGCVENMGELDRDNLQMYYDREDGSYEAIPTRISVEPLRLEDGSTVQCVWVYGLVDHFSKYIIATGPPTGSVVYRSF